MRRGLSGGVPACLGWSWHFQDFLNWCTNGAAWSLLLTQNNDSADSIRHCAAGSLVGSLHGSVSIVSPEADAGFDGTSYQFCSRIAIETECLVPSMPCKSQRHPVGWSFCNYRQQQPARLANRTGFQGTERHGTKKDIFVVPRPKDVAVGNGLWSQSGNHRDYLIASLAEILNPARMANCAHYNPLLNVARWNGSHQVGQYVSWSTCRLMKKSLLNRRTQWCGELRKGFEIYFVYSPIGW